eukprot:CAMPEP_0172503724 /NCGR_PEP_ID=MMETSP1066-20121228/171671_1 /TAXON_ID=671091 /ORGANISM="Coscinodiscus wailesii, Strain CCMP2513" /LENGTH=75 /DNA_ID=CAMNT_0013279571 /DNA_START=51 /DNA_END=275 /DNA_ORIENTATION=-
MTQRRNDGNDAIELLQQSSMSGSIDDIVALMRDDSGSGSWLASRSDAQQKNRGGKKKNLETVEEGGGERKVLTEE